MLLATISSESRWKARQKFLEYRHAVQERHNAEDEMLMKGYRALSMGRQVVDIHQTIRQAGVDAFNRPKLAISRADAVKCWFSVSSHGGIFDNDFWKQYHKRSATRIVIPGEFPQVRAKECWALLPSIPPPLRPKHELHNYHILWEAKWEGAPIDPALLKHIAGPLYAVVATWDLSELERAVLELRARN
jgi:hypothetical protein